MAGIMACSATETMVAGDTSADNSHSGYIAAEMVTLSVTPSGTSYSWGQSIPSGSATTRSALSSTTDASPTFTPDVAGEWVITCLVSGVTTYVLRLSVTAIATTTMAEAFRLQPVADGSVSAPAGTTLVLYNSATQGALAVKNSSGTIYTVDVTEVP